MVVKSGVMALLCQALAVDVCFQANFVVFDEVGVPACLIVSCGHGGTALACGVHCSFVTYVGTLHWQHKQSCAWQACHNGRCVVKTVPAAETFVHTCAKTLDGQCVHNSGCATLSAALSAFQCTRTPAPWQACLCFEHMTMNKHWEFFGVYW